MDDIQKLLYEKNTLTHTNQGILIAKVTDSTQGLELAREILSLIIDPKTLLLLSGGRTPKELYTVLASEELVEPGAVGLIDERYGEKFHMNSNETMVRDTGLLRYFEMRGISFFPILSDGVSRADAASRYDEKLRDLQYLYQKTVGILGIGLDGHTAGIPARNSEFRIKSSELNIDSDLVMDYNDKIGKYGERVTLTFLGLEHIDFFIVLVFGEDKKEALDGVFSDGSEDAIPGRFYKRRDIAKKVLIITDQQI